MFGVFGPFLLAQLVVCSKVWEWRNHKQLNPLVLASGGDFEMKDKKVDRSFMERAMECGCPLHPLRIQYRMPDILCRLVSTLFYRVQLSMGE